MKPLREVGMVLVFVVVIFGLILGLFGAIDALTTAGADERPVIRDGRVCIEYLDVWGNAERTECEG